MRDRLDIIRKLVALSTSPNREEAAAAAIKACAMIIEHHIDLVQGVPKSTSRRATPAPPTPKPAPAPPPYPPYPKYDFNADWATFETLRRAAEAMRQEREKKQREAWDDAYRSHYASPFKTSYYGSFMYDDPDPITQQCPMCGEKWYVGDRCPRCKPVHVELKCSHCGRTIPPPVVHLDGLCVVCRERGVKEAAERKARAERHAEEARAAQKERERKAVEDLGRASAEFKDAQNLTAEEIAKLSDAFVAFAKATGRMF